MQYTDFQNQVSSEKLVLARLNASKRLMGWSVHSGSVYKIEGFAYPVVVSVEDSGTAYTLAADVASVTASKYFLDRSTGTIYIRTTGSDNPNSRFIVVTVQLSLANIPIALPHDLDEGFEVPFEPLIKSTSEFGVTIDTINQTSEAIEGAGSLTLQNDYEFWPANYDKLSFENQRCILYSYNRDLEVADAKLLFKGKVESQTYSKDTISFKLKDQFAELRAPIPLGEIQDLEERTGEDIAKAKQRMIFGRAFGIRPVNIDQILDGYPLTGTASITFGSATLTGSGTAFLTELSPDDEVVLLGQAYTVATVASNTSITLTENFNGDDDLSGDTIYVLPDKPKRYANRRFLVAGHALREPVTTIEGGSTVQVLFVDDNSDMYAGDSIYIGPLGSGEVVTIAEVSGHHYIRLATSLANVPSVGTAVRKPAVQNVRIDDTLLVYYRDYTFDAETSILELRDTAEANAGAIRQYNATLDFTSGSRVVTVTGGAVTGVIQPGYMLGRPDVASYHEVLSVDSNTQITLRENADSSLNGTAKYKPLVYDHESTVLTLDCLGRTDDGTPDGALLKTAPSITRALLIDAGLESDIDEGSFTAAEDVAYQEIGIAIPADNNSSNAPAYRDVLNMVNKSVMGSLVQGEDFNFKYHVLEPRKPSTAPKFMEADILGFNLNASSENIVKTVIVEYKRKEYDYVSKKDTIQTAQQSNDNANYLIKTDRSKTISTYLVNEADAAIMAARWSFLLRGTQSRLQFSTKLQGATLEIGDIIEIEHRKFFERYGTSSKRKLFMVESVKRNGSMVNIEATDLSSTFNRVACINESSNDWADASDSELLYGGYYTDDYGLIDTDPDSFDTNLIW